MSIELPGISRHRRDMTDTFLKATLNSNKNKPSKFIYLFFIIIIIFFQVEICPMDQNSKWFISSWFKKALNYDILLKSLRLERNHQSLSLF